MQEVLDAPCIPFHHPPWGPGSSGPLSTARGIASQVPSDRALASLIHHLVDCVTEQAQDPPPFSHKSQVAGHQSQAADGAAQAPGCTACLHGGARVGAWVGMGVGAGRGGTL